MLVLENEWLSISFDEDRGVIKRLYDKQREIEYIPRLLDADPFRIEINERTTADFQQFSFRELQIQEMSGYEFTWAISDQITLTSTIKLNPDTDEIYFDSDVSNESDNEIYSLEYPIIPNIGEITEDGQDDHLAHSFATGVSIHNPMANFTTEWNGLRFMPYPEGFSGATMQFFSYFGQGKGGLYFAAYDGESYAKWLNFYKNENQLLEASFIHGYEDIGPFKGINVSYPVVVKLLDGQGWYEGADIYKTWAIQQYWCQKGTLAEADESEKCDWLLEEMGVSTFGINAGSDRTQWFQTHHDHLKTKMFHILGPDWTHQIQSFGSGVPGGLDDWFPTKFNQRNLESMASFGDKYAPFEFDYLFNVNGADGELGKKALQRIPAEKSIDAYKFSLICPAEPYVQRFHIERDERLQEEANVDSIYYDISANNILKICMDESHGHPKGAGSHITMAYRENYIKTKEAMMKKADLSYIPMGTEMMNEVFLDTLDYYQARAGAQPAAPLEGWNIRELMKSGEAEIIPMFTYVYHEYGPVRLDGWGKLVEEIGDLFYFTVARTYLWGGLYELNYEYSPLEAIDGVENTREEHYYPFEPQGYPFSPRRAEYISKFAHVRTGVGNKYLAYGKMLRPLKFDCEKVNLCWSHYNCAKNFKEYNDSGELAVDSIVHSVWESPGRQVGLFFANVSNEDQEITVNPAGYVHGKTTAKIHVDGKFVELVEELSTLTLSIPQKSVLLIEI
ncbi:DUF6259 domain-containing protein [Bacillus sp. Marseille-Q3570]|uniref:DUF6259 domain-containing protein n=1 Tax=Bacillus sp. Marseille-Q3570 TaxID=2963522 RepID=UPI0021B71ADF|nr:DUF6259 domain-containing protein [Bacillus sp. Marseille-Q3570]